MTKKAAVSHPKSDPSADEATPPEGETTQTSGETIPSTSETIEGRPGMGVQLPPTPGSDVLPPVDESPLEDPGEPKKYYATSVLRDGEALVHPGEEVTHLSAVELEELRARGSVELR